MPSILKRTVFAPVAYLPEKVKTYTAGFFLGRFKKELGKKVGNVVVDEFLELLLKGMDLCFFLLKDYREDNIENFTGRYLFVVGDKDDNIVTSATFKNGSMRVKDEGIEDWDAKIAFKDTSAFKEFIFSKDQDILNSILKNDVQVDGNLNYIYKFGFMARDLQNRFGL